jgi:hypothetical protein
MKNFNEQVYKRSHVKTRIFQLYLSSIIYYFKIFFSINLKTCIFWSMNIFNILSEKCQWYKLKNGNKNYTSIAWFVYWIKCLLLYFSLIRNSINSFPGRICTRVRVSEGMGVWGWVWGWGRSLWPRSAKWWPGLVATLYRDIGIYRNWKAPFL